MTEVDNSKAMPKRRRPTRAASPRPPTKRAQLIHLLSRRAGCDILSISKALGWQSHSTRAALSGLRKAGYDLGVEKTAKGKPARYRITAAPPEAGARTVPEAPADAG